MINSLLIAVAALLLAVGVYASTAHNEVQTQVSPLYACSIEPMELRHGGGLNACGCHFNRKQGTCHCHRNRGCGCECEPASC